jgi:hypothetical protein
MADATKVLAVPRLDVIARKIAGMRVEKPLYAPPAPV